VPMSKYRNPLRSGSQGIRWWAKWIDQQGTSNTVVAELSMVEWLVTDMPSYWLPVANVLIWLILTDWLILVNWLILMTDDWLIDWWLTEENRFRGSTPGFLDEWVKVRKQFLVATALRGTLCYFLWLLHFFSLLHSHWSFVRSSNSTVVISLSCAT
jgi:hypothetical protein